MSRWMVRVVCSPAGRLNSVKMWLPPKHRFETSPVKTPAKSFVDVDEIILKPSKRSQKTKAILKKNKAGGIQAPDVRTCPTAVRKGVRRHRTHTANRPTPACLASPTEQESRATSQMTPQHRCPETGKCPELFLTAHTETNSNLHVKLQKF